MVSAEWIAHRRADGEVVGWIVPAGEAFAAVDLLGRRVTGEPVDWAQAEQALDDHGIGYLADAWWLLDPDGSRRPVRVGEASPERIVVVADDFGTASVVGAEPETFVLDFPAADVLRPR